MTNRTFGLMSVLAVVIAVGVAAHPASADDGVTKPRERWFVALMDGKKMGWMRERVEVEGDQITSRMEMELRIARGPGSVKVLMSSEFVETADGEPVRMTAKQNLASTLSGTIWEFKDDGVDVLIIGAGDMRRSTEPLPEGEWLTPMEAERFVRARLNAGAKSIRVRGIEPFYGLQPMTSEYEVVGETTVEAMGKMVPAIEWRVTVTAMPGIVQTEYVDSNGELVRATTDLGGLKVTILASDKETAMAEFDAPEMMASTLVEVDRNLDDKMMSRRASFLLTAPNNDLPDLIEAGAQRVERLGPGQARVRVDLDDPVDLVDGSIESDDYLAATIAADHEDEMIRRLAAEALDGAPVTPSLRALELVVFVSEFINDKSLDVGFATASEVCRTREGDCSEHAVLLAALLRADGIPSRVVSGLVYVPEFLGKESVFGYHMWTQALIENNHGVEEWIDLDAAYPMNGLHIALDASSLADDESMNSMVTLARVLGNLSIEVESVE